MSNTFTLKQLHKMAKELEKKYLSSVARAEMFNVNAELSIHDETPIPTLVAANSQLVGEIDTFTSAALANFVIRNAIAAGNRVTTKQHKLNIDEILGQIAMLNTIIHGLEFLEKTDAPSVNDIAIVIRQLQSNKSTLANSSSYVSDRIGISALTPAARDSVKEQLKTLRKQRDGLNDELTAMNITITQELKADDIAKLTRLGIL